MGYSKSEQSIHYGDAKVIVATPISRGQVCDHVAWTHAVDGRVQMESS